MSMGKTDLGTDPIGKLLFKLAIPAIFAQVVNALYNIVDRMYIGHMPENGDLALTGLGVTFSIIMIITAFSALIGFGGSPLASIKLGEGKPEEAEQILSNCFIMLCCISVVLTTVFLIFQRPLLLAFGATENTIQYAVDYLSIYLIGTIFVQISIGLNAFITAQGFATTAMATVLIGAVINIVLDPILIYGFDMGVKGAAIATVLSQAVSAIWVLIFLFGKKAKIRINYRYFKLQKQIITRVLALGMSPFVMQSTESLLTITLNASLKAYGGDPAVGAMTIISSVMQMCLMPLQGLTQGAQPIISYNFGAKNFDRVRQAFKKLLMCAMIYAGAMWLIVMLFPGPIVSLFNDKPEIVELTTWAMRIFTAGLFAMGAQTACQQTFLALGQARISVILALLRKIVLLIPLILILSRIFGMVGIFAAEPIADITAATITVIIFATRFKKILQNAENEQTVAQEAN